MSAQKESSLKGRRLLFVGEELNTLLDLEKRILEVCMECKIDKATTYKETVEKMVSWTYDWVILDTPNGYCKNLLELAQIRNFPFTILKNNAVPFEVLKPFIRTNPYVLFSKEKIEEFIPFLENKLRYGRISRWRRLVERLKGFFLLDFESHWEKRTGQPWNEWGKVSL